MREWLRNYLRDLAEGCRVLCSRRFWRSFAAYWSSAAVAARMDRFAERISATARDETGGEG